MVRLCKWSIVETGQAENTLVIFTSDNGPQSSYGKGENVMTPPAGASGWITVWKKQPRYQEMLFDLVFDPTESCNITGKAGTEPVLKDMRDLLDRWMQETNDPILEGDIPLPECGITIDPDMYSPDGKR
jgi:arylsulfatase A-like enzyme